MIRLGVVDPAKYQHAARRYNFRVAPPEVFSPRTTGAGVSRAIGWLVAATLFFGFLALL